MFEFTISLIIYKIKSEDNDMIIDNDVIIRSSP